MPTNRVSWRSSRSVVLAVALAVGCGVDPVGEDYFIRWVFVNNSAADATFIGRNRTDASLVSRSVPQCKTDSVLQAGFQKTQSLDLEVTVSPGGQTSSVTVGLLGGNARVTAVWDGTNLTLTPSSSPMAGRPAGVATPFGPSARPPASSRLPAQAQTPYEPAAASCQAPVTWKLDGITGNASANWQDIAATATGTLTFSVPPEVTPGQTYAVSATFGGSITVNPGWAGYSSGVTVGITDRGIPGLVVNNSANTGRLEVGTFSQSVTVNGAWVIPSNPTSLAIEAAGGWGMAGPGNANPPKLVATYSRVP